MPQAVLQYLLADRAACLVDEFAVFDQGPAFCYSDDGGKGPGVAEPFLAGKDLYFVVDRETSRACLAAPPTTGLAVRSFRDIRATCSRG